MGKLSIDKALLKAKFHLKRGEIAEAQHVYREILQAFPKNKRALKAVNGLPPFKASRALPHPSQNELDYLLKLYNQNQMSAAIVQAQKLIKYYPTAFMVWNVLGAANMVLGRVQEAVEAFTRVTELNPHYADGFNNLGAILKDQRKLKDAIKAFKKAIAVKPDYAEAYYNMGVTFKEDVQQDQALEAYYKAIALKPDYAEAYYNIGIIFIEQKELEKAIQTFKQALAVKPNYAEAYYNVGISFADLGKLDKAIEAFKKALEVKPDYAEAYNNAANVFEIQGKLEKAIENYKIAIALKPDYAEAYNNKGNVLQTLGKLSEAVDAYNNATAFKPDYARAYCNMGNALKRQGDSRGAIEAYKSALTIAPDYVEVFNNLGATLRGLGELDKAINVLHKAIALKPDYAEAYNNMGNVLADQGKISEAIRAYRKVLSVKGEHADAHRNLSTLIKYEPDHPQVSEVSEIIARSDLKDEDRCQFYYTYAKMNEDLGYHDVAFENYVAGGELKKRLMSYDLQQDKSLFDQIKVTTKKLGSLSFKPSDQSLPRTPIFILGMPRSGTTLIEQIVSSHSKVFGAGELPFWSRFGVELSASDRVINVQDVLKVRKAYLDEVEKISDSSPFITDKMPHNFRFIGLILAALPEAKIIHVERDPAATCWSNFKQYFSTKGLGYSYNLMDTVNYFKLYQSLMSFWQGFNFKQIYNIKYENLTTQQELETKKLIDFLELHWEDGCLFPEKNKRYVGTASQRQVRQEIYQGSSQDWLKFEPYLDGVFEKFIGSS